jgi:hypothetical protein
MLGKSPRRFSARESSAQPRLQTMRALVARFSRELGREIKLMAMPRPVLNIRALAVPFLREIDEMLYQWEEPFEINDSRFRTRFGLGPEDVDRAAPDTVAWAKAHYARR